MLIKRLLLGPLILIVVWMTAAFFLVRNHNIAHKKDQLTLGSIGEPDNLNPIISQTTSASEVTGFVFNGLLKYDEHINVVGDLAEDHRITQDSVAFYPSAGLASQALAKLNAAKDRWPEMKLASCRRDGRKLDLRLADPKTRIVAGTSYEKVLFEIIDPEQLLPVSVLTLALRPGQKLADGTEVTATAVREKLPAIAADLRGTSIHEILTISDSLLSVSVTGDVTGFRTAIKQTFAGEKKKPPVSVLDYLDQKLLNEPTITFRIRKGVRWHDGVELTSADAAFTYRCLIDPKYRSPRASDYWFIKSVKTPEPYTFVVTYRVPYSDCVSSWMMSLLPKHILDGKSPQWWADNYNSKPVGTGPYRVAEWQRNEFVHLEANPDYFEGPPNLPAVMYRILPDPFVKQVAFDARGFDTNGLLPFQVKRYERDTKTFKAFRRWGLGYLYIGWNLKRPIFADRRVRVALAHAVDCDRIIKYVYRGYARRANGTFPFQMWYANQDIVPYPYDPELARKMLAEAGWRDSDGDGWLDKDGKRFEFALITNHGNTLRATIQMLVQDDLKKIGIKVNTAVYEWAVYITNYISPREFDACVLGWYVGYSFDQYQLWHSSQVEQPGLNNCTYRNDQVDQLLMQIRTTFDRQLIAKYCRQVQALIYHDQPYLFICYNEGTSAIYRDKYVVRRPDGDGGWILEPVRNTDAGYSFYSQWWAPRAIAPHLAQ